MKKLRITLISIISVILSLLIIFIAYTGVYYKSENVDSYLTSSEDVGVNINKKFIEFIPSNSNNNGIIFYPGGKVEYDAYAPLLYNLALSGYKCILLKMPFNLAIFGSSRAKNFIDDNYNWYIAGHSLGGAFGSIYASKNEKIKGVILLGAYSTKSLNGKLALSIYGSNDNVLNKDKYEKYKSNLPNDYKELVIDGGCHSYFGSYGNQKKDGNPTITRDEQINKTVEFIKKYI